MDGEPLELFEFEISAEPRPFMRRGSDVQTRRAGERAALLEPNSVSGGLVGVVVVQPAQPLTANQVAGPLPPFQRSMIL